MNAISNESERERCAQAIGVWDNEGGASGRALADEQYGRRIEADRSWTVYHVFSGVPASPDGQAMIGLSRSHATDGMLCLNRNADKRRRARVKLPLGRSATECSEVAQS